MFKVPEKLHKTSYDGMHVNWLSSATKDGLQWPTVKPRILEFSPEFQMCLDHYISTYITIQERPEGAVLVRE